MSTVGGDVPVLATAGGKTFREQAPTTPSVSAPQVEGRSNRRAAAGAGAIPRDMFTACTVLGSSADVQSPKHLAGEIDQRSHAITVPAVAAMGQAA
jgi:hypothetical protein